MTLNLGQMLTDLLSMLGQVLSQFTYFKNYLSNFMNNLNNFDFLTFITPPLATVKYVIGTDLYNMSIGLILFSLFIGLIKAFYQIVHILLNSSLIKKPTAIIKDLLNL